MRDYSTVPHTHVNQIIYGVGTLGHASVILFFTLSGFWVGGAVIRSLQQERFSWLRYGINRLTRLWLVLIPALALTAVVDVVGLRAFPHTSVFEGAHGYVNLPANLRSQLTVPTGIANLAFL
jgi:peptidoglycan/LPS O-acetylase OafA/YrhL